MGKSLCAKPDCEKESKHFISRKINGANEHLYCSIGCANLDALRRERLSPLELKTALYSKGAPGAQSQASSGTESVTKPESKPTASFTTKGAESDMQATQKSTEQRNMPFVGEESKALECVTELTAEEFERSASRTPLSAPLTPSLEVAKSVSMSLLDESISSMHELIHSVKNNIVERNKTASHKYVDPAQVNAAANCAREMANLMKVKIQFAGKK